MNVTGRRHPHHYRHYLFRKGTFRIELKSTYKFNGYKNTYFLFTQEKETKRKRFKLSSAHSPLNIIELQNELQQWLFQLCECIWLTELSLWTYEQQRNRKDEKTSNSLFRLNSKKKQQRQQLKKYALDLVCMIIVSTWQLFDDRN